jgi:TRAP-type C4-dicarboxylate transport system permease small subunit
MRRLGRLSRGVYVLEVAIVITCLFALVVVPGYQILARAVTALPLPLWTYDVATVFLLWLAFIGAAMAERAQTPPTVTILTDLLPLRVQGGLTVVGSAISIAIFAVIAFHAARDIPEQWGFGIGDLRVPLGLYNVALPIGAALIAVHLVARLRAALRLLTGRETEKPVEKRDEFV